MPGASTFQLLDLAYDGQLCALLHTWRDEGLSLESIIARIEQEKGYRPGRETIRRYLKDECP